MESCTHRDRSERVAAAEGRCDDMENSAVVVAFVFLYLFFGYYVAWQNPALRAYYGGTEFESLKSNWERQPHLYLLQVFRALLYVACVYPLLPMPQIARWKNVLAIAAVLASWTTALLLPNALMPESVAWSHFWETLWFNLTFGALMAWLLGKSRPGVESVNIV
jgi:hypothetical protein